MQLVVEERQRLVCLFLQLQLELQASCLLLLQLLLAGQLLGQSTGPLLLPSLARAAL
jgi:hypothetical protein